MPRLAEIDRATLDAAGRRAGRAFVCFRDPEDPSFSGSGVLVRVKGHVVVATAAHVSYEVPRNLIALMCPDLGNEEARTVVCRRGVVTGGLVHPDYDHSLPREALGRLEKPDVGIIGLKPSFFSELPFEVDPVEEHLLIPAAEADRSFLVVGAPVAESTLDGGIIEVVLRKSLALRTEEVTPRPGIIGLEWDRSIPQDGGPVVEAVAPPGMSGGPAFNVGGCRSSVWSPSEMPLAGITFFFDADQKRILVESIETWANWARQVDENTLRELCGAD
jgi:hypothetical protein